MATQTLNYESTEVRVRDVIDRLQRPVPNLPTLLSLLSGPLHCLGLLPPRFIPYNKEVFLSSSVDVLNHIPSLQRALLDYIAPTWDAILLEANSIVLLDQYFCPDIFSFALPTAENIVLLAYGAVFSQPLTKYGIDMLARMTKEYPVDRLHAAFFGRSDQESPCRWKGMLGWEDYVRNLIMVPAKVANAVAGKADNFPTLEHGSYFNNICLRCESLIFSLSKANGKGASRCRHHWHIIDRNATRCAIFCVLFISKTCKCGGLSRHTADISLAAILLPDHSNYDPCSTRGRIIQ